jgi:antitoxin component of MazEF toxin-antitoxin module
MERAVRQLIRVGNSTAVTLPPGRLGLLGLDRGALVEIQDAPGGLLVRPVGLWALPPALQRDGSRAQSTAALVQDLRTSLGSIYGRRLRALHQERPAAREVRFWIVLDRLDDYAAELERTGPLVAALSVKHRLTVRRIFVPLAEWNRWKRRFEHRRGRGTPARPGGPPAP